MSVDSETATTDEPTYSASALTIEQDAELDEKMPDSVKRFADGLQRASGRTFQCPSCGHASTGTCDECGYRHPQLREGTR